MQKLLDYIKAGQIDNAKLLELYEELGWNKLLAQSMRRNSANRDKYIRYEIWKMLPADVRVGYKQDLSEIVKAPEGESEQVEVVEKDKTGEETLDTGKKEPGQEETGAEGDVVKNKATEPMPNFEIGGKESGGAGDLPELPDAGKKPEEEPKEEEGGTDEAPNLVVQKAQLYNQRAKLTNSLHNFAPEDNAGRKAVLDEIEALEERINKLTECIEGKQDEQPQRVKREYDWLKTNEEKARMTDAEIKVYKTTLTNRRGKASSAIKLGEKVEENTRIIQIIDNERLTLG